MVANMKEMSPAFALFSVNSRFDRLLQRLFDFAQPVTDGAWRMDKAVARLNIEHYQKLLATETDAAKRETLRHLLGEEEAKLAALMAAPDAKTAKR